MDTVISQFPNLEEFTKYKEKDEFIFDDGTITNLVHSDFFEKEINGRVISIGVFSYKKQNLFCAWGYKDEEHCSMHAVIGENGEWLPAQAGCPIKIGIKEGGNNVGLRIPTGQRDQEFYF